MISYDSSSDSEFEQTNNTSTSYQHTNTHGLLTDTFVLDEVLQSFLADKVLKGENGGGGNGQEMKSITIVLGNQWSMVTVEDRAVGMDGGLRKRSRDGGRHEESHGGEEDVGYSRRLRRGGRGSLASSVSLHGSSLPSKKNNADNNNRVQLRGSNTKHHQQQQQRSLASLPSPHLIFQLQIYGKYNEKKSSSFEGNSLTTAMAEASAQRTTSNFGNHLSTRINSYRDELIGKMRRRSGYDQECNPTSTNRRVLWCNFLHDVQQLSATCKRKQIIPS